MQQHSETVLNSTSSIRDRIYQDLHQCRAATLALVEGINYETFCRQAHPDFSPVGWHLGHIAYTESLWLLERSAGKPAEFAQYHRLFAADGLPKTERVYLPTLAQIRCYLDTVRKQVLDYLNIAPLEKQERLWRFIIQHESQHSEIMTFVLKLQGQGRVSSFKNPVRETNLETDSMIEIPAGEFIQGNASIDALDNECPIHRVYLDTYWIDRYPVTCQQYQQFMEAGGYQHRQWWSDAGWQWLQANPVTQPLYWQDDSKYAHHPVCGVSWYEAEAYARFVKKRLPTEAEWEKAASWDAVNHKQVTYPWGEAFPNQQLCNNCDLDTTPVNAYPSGKSFYGCYDMLGNVWEWTDSWFDGYKGFASYPYRGYSQVYFDHQHRVLKGGSWATRPWALRSSFRNWYHPQVRQILAGFRCASS